MEELYKAIEDIGKVAEQVGMTAKEFCEYLKMLASNAPVEAIEEEIHELKIENERWDWLDDINE